jgi:thymidylate synthase
MNPKVSDIRNYFINELKNQSFTVDKTGQKTIELIGASFVADEPAIFGEPNNEYIDKELAWYKSQSPNVNDIYEEGKAPPAAWQYAANKYGEINSNYGLLIWSKKYFSQYSHVLRELRNNPDGRRATMVYNRPSIWVEYDENGKSDFICTNAVSYYIRNNKLHAVVQMRSNDVVYGYKNDYAWQKHVLDQLADASGVRPGQILWQVQNLHVYEKHFALVK